jgi:hypothetical protein
MALMLWIHTTVRLALRRILQVDKPVPPRSDDEISAEVERNYRWNLSVNLIEGASFMFGMSLVSSSTIVPLFISKLTPNPLPIGLASVVAQGGWFLPQLFTANLVERLPRRMPVVVNAGFFLERLPMLLLPGIALVAGQSASLALLSGEPAWPLPGHRNVCGYRRRHIGRCPEHTHIGCVNLPCQFRSHLRHGRRRCHH